MVLPRVSFFVSIALLVACSDDPITGCSDTLQIVSEYTNSDGVQVQIFEDGKAYFANDNCSFAAEVFDPGFFEKNYEETQDGISIIVDETIRLPVQLSFNHDFEDIDDWRDLILTENLEKDRIFTNLTFQSPSTPTVESYNTLQKCLIMKECDFNDSRIDLVSDPVDELNQVLRFYAVAPVA